LTTFTIISDDNQDLSGQNAEDVNMYQEPHYITLLKQIAETEEYTLDVDCCHILEFNKSLYRQLEDYPTDVIPIFDLVAVQVFKEHIAQNHYPDGVQGSNMPDYEQSEQIIQVRPYNLKKVY
jgi:DNA replicative helicase MCM subunit Mcm2 (Cdc46/Mcm family)